MSTVDWDEMGWGERDWTIGTLATMPTELSPNEATNGRYDVPRRDDLSHNIDIICNVHKGYNGTMYWAYLSASLSYDL